MTDPGPEPRAVGRCLCGDVAFAVRGPLRDVLDCHCHRCRRWSGHHLAASAAAAADIVLTDPRESLRWHRVDGAAYGFCGTCGSSLFWRGDSTPEQWSVCAGTFEPPTGLRTTMAWWTSEASDYHVRPPMPEAETE